MSDSIHDKISNWSDRQKQEIVNNQQRYRELIIKFDTLSAGEEAELEYAANTLGIPQDKIGQHVLAWRTIKDNETVIAETDGLIAEQKQLYAELQAYQAETQRIIKERQAKSMEIDNRMNKRKSEVAERWRLDKETQALRWDNRELFFDDQAIVDRAREMDRQQRIQQAMKIW